MHMADALLSPAVGGAFWAGTAGTIGYASRKLARNPDDRRIPLMGVLGAFVFASQMINFTIPGTGSSGHLGGGLILAVLLGPYAAFLVMASVLTVQSLFFADGGLLALGCNIWNLGIYPCMVAYPLVYGPIAGDGRSPRRAFLASMAGAVAGLQMGAFSVVLQTVLSGRSELPFGTFLLLMQPIHLAIGVVEGFVTAGVVHYVRVARPDVPDLSSRVRPNGGPFPARRIAVAFAFLAVVAGGVLSWFASAHPDGLEWSIARITGRGELPGREDGVAAAARTLQEKTAILPGYGFPARGRTPGKTESATSWPNVDGGTSLSGLAGAAMVLAVALGIGWAVRSVRGRIRPPRGPGTESARPPR